MKYNIKNIDDYTALKKDQIDKINDCVFDLHKQIIGKENELLKKTLIDSLFKATGVLLSYNLSDQQIMDEINNMDIVFIIDPYETPKISVNNNVHTVTYNIPKIKFYKLMKEEK